MAAIEMAVRTQPISNSLHQLADGDATGEQAQRRADPGEERPLVGEREPIVGLAALRPVTPTSAGGDTSPPIDGACPVR